MNASTRLSTLKEEPTLMRWIKAHSLIAYFALTFLITFGAWVAALFTGCGALFDLGLWGPAISAILTTAVIRGRPGLKDLLRRLLHWRVPARWYLVILFGWPVIALSAALIHAQITHQPLNLRWDRWASFQAFLVSAPVLGFWACEEIGWRGFALPHLLNRWNAFLSSIILGTVWAAWHLPYYIGNTGINPEFYALPVFTISLSILMTWVFNHTRDSLFVATFFHFWVNIYSALQADKLPASNLWGETLIQYGLLAGAALIVIALYGYRTLTRKEHPIHLQYETR